MRYVFGVLAVVVLLVIGISWVAEGNDFFLYKVFAPARANVERQVFTNTKSYRQGMVQELQQMQFAIVGADSAHKEALASVYLQEAVQLPDSEMPPALRSFTDSLRRSR